MQRCRWGPHFKLSIPHLILIAHATMAQPERIRAAMRAGFRDFVVLPEDAALLRRTVREAPSDNVVASDQGQVIAVIGAKGGVDGTFVTVNLGAELAPVNRVCAVDLDFSMGDVAGMLDMEPASHMVDLLNNLSRLDERMLAGSVGVTQRSARARAAAELVENEFLRGEDVLRVLSAAADAYQVPTRRLWRAVDEATHTASTVADLILLVCSPDVPSVKTHGVVLHLLERQGVDLTRVRLIVNRLGPKPPLSAADIESNLGTRIAGTIANEPARCQHAVNVGALLRDVDKRCQAARDLSALVALITDGVDEVEAEPADGPLSWLFK